MNKLVSGTSICFVSKTNIGQMEKTQYALFVLFTNVVYVNKKEVIKTGLRSLVVSEHDVFLHHFIM